MAENGRWQLRVQWRSAWLIVRDLQLEGSINKLPRWYRERTQDCLNLSDVSFRQHPTGQLWRDKILHSTVLGCIGGRYLS